MPDLSESPIYYGLVVAFTLAIISVIAVVISENRNPLKSLAWIMVLTFLPVVGIIIYLILGRNMRHTRIISRRKRRKLLNNGMFQKASKYPYQDCSPTAETLIALGKKLNKAECVGGNKIDIFTAGKDKFKELLTDIRNASKYINLQYYIFKEDKIGKEICEALIERAEQGVIVRVIFDHVGSFSMRHEYFKKMRRAGIQIEPFMKVTFPQLANRINWRNHRKVVVIDGKIGYIGGMNIADRYTIGNHLGTWRDTHLRINGPAVMALQYSFAVDWHFLGHDLLDDPFEISYHNDGVNIQTISGGPMGNTWNGISLAIQKAIAIAKKRIYIQTPYFLPNETLLHALQLAALAGIDVKIMIPRHTESVLLTQASMSYVQDCLQSGIQVLIYDNGMLHSKMMLIDDDIVTTGSANFDFRSLEQNFEINAFIYNNDFCSKMLTVFEQDETHCKMITQAEWRQRPLHHRALQSIMRLFSPLL